jgi:hypothetical protein
VSMFDVMLAVMVFGDARGGPCGDEQLFSSSGVNYSSLLCVSYVISDILDISRSLTGCAIGCISWIVKGFVGIRSLEDGWRRCG